jgi:hypothetical protein
VPLDVLVVPKLGVRGSPSSVWERYDKRNVVVLDERLVEELGLSAVNV